MFHFASQFGLPQQSQFQKRAKVAKILPIWQVFPGAVEASLPRVAVRSDIVLRVKSLGFRRCSRRCVTEKTEAICYAGRLARRCVASRLFPDL